MVLNERSRARCEVLLSVPASNEDGSHHGMHRGLNRHLDTIWASLQEEFHQHLFDNRLKYI